MNNIINGIHIPSFALGFGSCVLLYYLKPGLVTIFGGLISFLKVSIVFAIITGGVVFALKSQPQHDKKDIAQESKLRSIPGRLDTIKSKEANIQDGEFNYFPIPVTKFEDDPQRQIPHSRYEEISNQSIQLDKSMADSKNYYVEETNKYDKTLRYENFVKMASKR
ncbi:hypothetical protein MOSE0_G07756 [Monosporozyma servazzii]